jgi:hypothetical protein
MADRLTLAHALEEGGIARQPAETIATEIFEAIRTNVATKTDLVEMENRVIVRFGRMIAIATGLIIAAVAAATATATTIILHYLP